ncbi:uncharacterized protein A4U43_C04F25600 [Asparagus officinalis]|uniref:O-fucosyltransferase family protein n=1 Tax=Asparagus officinalis TaxID=4686 RepID=A0A5P1F5D7_ASPOF|nr:uncharacterized protein A4U43_C04F25600 [Asparagus officinalis]
MAALDYIVCDGSDVFVTNNNGNMAKMLAGRRRYFGHKRTIRPNAKKLGSLFMNRTQMTWDVFASKVRSVQKGFMGDPNEIRPGRGEFHENPSACLCEKGKDHGLEILTKAGNKNGHDNLINNGGERIDYLSGDEEQDLLDLDYGENAPLGKGLSERAQSEDPWEEMVMLSD